MFGYILDATGYLGKGVLAIILFFLVFEGMLLWKGKRVSWFERTIMAMFGIYLTVILAVTVSPVYGFHLTVDFSSANFTPFRVIRHGLGNPLNLFGNVAMFIPFGILFPLLSRKMQRGAHAILAGAMLSVTIEGLQLFLGRETDIDDVILNTIGVVVGYVVAKIVLNIFPSIRRMIGIEVMKNGKKLRRDFMPTVFLSALIFVSVMVTGFERRYSYDNAKAYAHAEDEDYSKEMAMYSDFSDVIDNKEESVTKELPEEVTARNVFFINVTTGKVISALDENDKIAPASTTKMLTALTVLDYCRAEEIVTVGEEVSLIPSNASRAGIYQGNEATIEQLLEGLLLPSGGDAAYVLAAYTGRKIVGDNSASTETAVDAFIKKMNEKAKKLGAADSHFTTPDGFDDKGQYSTARDLGVIAEAFLSCTKEDAILRTIAGKESSRVCLPDGTDITWQNTNLLLDSSSEFFYERAIGLKTGSTDQAGKCLVSAAIVNNEMYIAVVMGDTDEGRYIDSIALYESVE
ncbi:VanZ family protein [Anaerosporobacter sp.]|uniref:VanZ family protein n=1 Tax=Anaerosporobacter sp. TaxID=1872529 RepID=UPI00286F08ED|nr:VanZ family protein [Anaerosporobacter sp.]